MLQKSVILTIAATGFAAIFAFSILWLTSTGPKKDAVTPSPSSATPASTVPLESGKPNEAQTTLGEDVESLPKSPDADQVYLTRARIDSLPSADGKFSLMLHHEEIKDFIGKNGTVVGMKEMIMPFPDVAKEVNLAGLKEGDLVEAVFEVRWNKPPRTLLTSLRLLPAGTQLNLSQVVEDAR